MKRNVFHLILLLVLLTAFEGFAQVTEEARQEQLKLLKDYQGAPDKVAFLVAHAESPQEWVLAWVARELGNHEDPRVLPVLQKLRTHKQKYSELTNSVSGEARRSIERLQASPDMRRLQGKEPLSVRLRIARQYAAGVNDYARRAVLKFLLGEAAKNPDEVVPLLVEFYAGKKQSRTMILRHPKIARKALPKGLRSPNTSVMAACAGLVAELEAQDCLPQLALFLCADRETGVEARIILASRMAFMKLGNTAVPHLERVLYSGNYLAQLDAVQDLQYIGTPEALKALKDFREVYSSPWSRVRRKTLLLRNLTKAIQEMEKGK